jgi:hypothetical protein
MSGDELSSYFYNLYKYNQIQFVTHLIQHNPYLKSVRISHTFSVVWFPHSLCTVLCTYDQFCFISSHINFTEKSNTAACDTLWNVRVLIIILFVRKFYSAELTTNLAPMYKQSQVHWLIPQAICFNDMGVKIYRPALVPKLFQGYVLTVLFNIMW